MLHQYIITGAFSLKRGSVIPWLRLVVIPTASSPVNYYLECPCSIISGCNITTLKIAASDRHWQACLGRNSKRHFQEPTVAINVFAPISSGYISTSSHNYNEMKTQVGFERTMYAMLGKSLQYSMQNFNKFRQWFRNFWHEASRHFIVLKIRKFSRCYIRMYVCMYKSLCDCRLPNKALICSQSSLKERR